MIIPTKGISADRALLTVGAQILQQLDQPCTVSASWHSLRDWRQRTGRPDNISFSWFVLALDVLYALGAVSYENGLLRKEAPGAPRAE
jgi:hypothetical protein